MLLDYVLGIFSHDSNSLTHISMVSYVWDIGKLSILRCEQRGVPSTAILSAERNSIHISHLVSQNESRLTQSRLITMLPSLIARRWVGRQTL